MHNKNTKSEVLIFGKKLFNNTLSEIKEFLNFTPIFFIEESKEPVSTKTKYILVHCDVFENIKILNMINELKNKSILLINKPNSTNYCNFKEKMISPISLNDLNKKITNLVSSSHFSKNSSIKIKEYILDKNEKRLKKNELSIMLTEREIQLIQLLAVEKKPILKKNILHKVWNYADDADTHTVETRICRLRQKIIAEFDDKNFIINSKKGYLI